MRQVFYVCDFCAEQTPIGELPRDWSTLVSGKHETTTLCPKCRSTALAALQKES